MHRVVFFLIATAIPAWGQFQEDWNGEVEGSEKIQYKQVGETKLHLFVFRSIKQNTGAPAIVFFHGGGWQNGAPTQFEKHGRYLSSRGMVVVTAEYRVEDRHKTKATEAVADAKSAIRWVRSHAKKLGVDSKRIAAGGGSAGGQLATSAALLDGFNDRTDDRKVSCVPNALVLFNPACVLAPIDERADFIHEKYRADILARLGVPGKQLSPWHHIKKGMPPTIVHHGSIDHATPLWTAKVFVEKSRKAGNQSELAIYKGEDHGFFNFGLGGNKMFIATVRRTDEFLIKLGWLKGKPTIDRFIASLPKGR